MRPLRSAHRRSRTRGLRLHFSTCRRDAHAALSRTDRQLPSRCCRRCPTSSCSACAYLPLSSRSERLACANCRATTICSARLSLCASSTASSARSRLKGRLECVLSRRQTLTEQSFALSNTGCHLSHVDAFVVWPRVAKHIRTLTARNLRKYDGAKSGHETTLAFESIANARGRDIARSTPSVSAGLTIQ